MSNSEKQKYAIHAYLTPEAHSAVTWLSEETGASITGLLISVFMDLYIWSESNNDDGTDGLPEFWKERVKFAHRMDSTRRRR